MEKNINTKLETFQIKFKNDIKDWLVINNANIEDKMSKALLNTEFLQFVYDYTNMHLDENDFKKRKRIKNIVPNFELCIAKRANGEQCTRKKKTDGPYKDQETNFCGTHIKGTPHGVVSVDVEHKKPNAKVEVWVKDFQGINYYIDDQHNVYNPVDILSNKVNPSVIGKWHKTAGDVYSLQKMG